MKKTKTQSRLHDAVLGEYVVISKNTLMGKGVIIGNGVIIHKGTIIGNNVTIQDYAIIGKPVIRSVLSRSTLVKARGKTKIGDRTTIGAFSVIISSAEIGERCLVGDHAIIREGSKIGDETIVGGGVIVENNTKVGKRVKLQTACYITADMLIENDVFVGPKAVTTNDKYMGKTNDPFRGPVIRRNARIGANAVLLPGVVIGRAAVVGAGAVVTKDVKARATVLGVPAKQIKRLD